MGAIGGICRWGGQPLDPSVAKRMIGQLQRVGWAGQGRVLATPGAAVVHHDTPAPHQAIIQGLARCGLSGCLVAADARIDNRDELAATLANPSVAPPGTDAELILAAYLRWGTQTPEHLIGDFAFTIWDPGKHRFFCARDRMGVRPLYYHTSGEQFACASHPAVLLDLPGIASHRNEERLVCYLLDLLAEDSDTFYTAVRRLPPGHTLLVGPQGAESRQYWSPLHIQTLVHGDDQECAARFQALFLEAVRCRSHGAGPIGSTLSGGLDSSFIACAAAAQRRADPGDRLHTFSATFASLPPSQLSRIDERSYMQAVQRSCNPVSHELRADHLNPFATLEQDVRSAGQPYFGPNMYLHNGMYHLAATNGVRVFLDGIDGDSVVSYGFERLPHLLLTGRWPRLFDEIAGLKETSKSRQSLGRLLWGYSLKPVLKAWVQRLAHPRFVAPARLQQRLQLLRPELSRRVDVQALLRRHWQRMRLPIFDAATHHRAALSQPFLSHILENCALFSARYGIEPRYPFLDHRLVSFCLALPPEQKFSQGWSRVVQRRAMAGWVPEPVIRRVSKADLSPNYYHGLVQHGHRLLETDIRPGLPQLADYVEVDALLLRLRTCLHAPEHDPDGAIFFFTAACLSKWLSSSVDLP